MRRFENVNHALSPTYPFLSVIPKAVSDAAMVGCANFRTKKRFPAMTYFDRQTGCSLWRSSQV